MTHDDTVKKLIAEYKSADKKRYTDLFLSSLSSPKWNSGLYVYASMKTFPAHDFSERNDDVSLECYSKWTDEQKEGHRRTMPCQICSSYRENISDVTDYQDFYFVAGLTANDIYAMLYIMEQINQLEYTPNILLNDFEMFKEILLLLKESPPDAKIRDIQKRFNKSDYYISLVKNIKLAGEKQGASDTASSKIQSILETLGVCGILHTDKYKSPFYEYTNLAVAPRSSHSSDWAYPVDFWRGKDGIDWNVFDYWFGGYKELSDLR